MRRCVADEAEDKSEELPPPSSDSRSPQEVEENICIPLTLAEPLLFNLCFIRSSSIDIVSIGPLLHEFDKRCSGLEDSLTSTSARTSSKSMLKREKERSLAGPPAKFVG